MPDRVPLADDCRSDCPHGRCRRLHQLPDDAVEDFVTLYSSGTQPFLPEERRAIIAFAKGYPLALRVACSQLLRARERSESLEQALRRADDEVKAIRPTW